VRTIEQCLSEARQDITVQTNLLEARWVAGSKPLFRRFDATVHAHLDVKAFFDAKLLEQPRRVPAACATSSPSCGSAPRAAPAAAGRILRSTG
jgi:UTP:GlnB (protein PII) uridylyltransferase